MSPSHIAQTERLFRIASIPGTYILRPVPHAPN